MRNEPGRIVVGAALWAGVVLALGGCAASRQHAAGLQEMAAGERERGLADLSAASAAEPMNSQYRLDFLTQLNQAVNGLLARGDEARRTGQVEAARKYYNDTLHIHPGNDRALRGLSNLEMDERHNAIVAESRRLLEAHEPALAQEKLHTVLLENGSRADAKALAVRIADELDRAEAQRVARIASSSVMKKPVSLQFRDANLRMVFEALSRTTGLNTIFDRDVRNDLKTTIFVRDASVEDTVDMILLQSQLEKKVLNANTLFIYPATPAKQKEYQDLKVRLFQLSNADGKSVQAILKTVLRVADMTLDDKTNTLIVRGTPDMIAIAEKIIAAQDVPDPEVMLEVEVLEVSSDSALNLGIQWPSAIGVQTPSTANTVQSLGQVSLRSLGVVGGPFGVNAAFSLADSGGKVLAAPRLRTRDNQKAKILIGEKVPVITNTITPVSTGTPVVTGSVQYLDVGIKLEIKPHVYLEGDVGIELMLEVSSILGQVTPPGNNSGTVAYDIGTRDVSTNLRLRDGETQILGGLIQDNETLSANKVPALGEFPLLNRLFGSNSNEDKKTEVVLSITPHILRAPVVADSRAREMFSGTESAVREAPLRLDPVGSVSGGAGGTPVTPGFVGGGASGGAAQGALPPSALPPGAPANLPIVNPNYPRNDPRVPVPRHEVPPGVTPPPWITNPPAQPGGEAPAPVETQPSPAPTPPVSPN